MSDAVRRQLEHEVARDGSAAARLRLARELDRVGRRDDALPVLLPARDAVEVREEIARLGRTGDPARGFFDVPPMVERPRLAWKTKLQGRGHTQCFVIPSFLAATPLAVVAQHGDGPVVVLDDEGKERPFRQDGFLGLDEKRRVWRLDAGTLLFVTPGRLRAIDVWTGALLSDAALDAFTIDTGPGRALVAETGEDELGVFSLPTATKPATLEACWRIPSVGGRSRPKLGVRGVTRECVVLGRLSSTIVVDRRTGAVAWSAEARRAWVAGERVLMDAGDKISARHANGAILWDVPRAPLEVASSGTKIVAVTAESGLEISLTSVDVLDAATGEPMSTLGPHAGTSVGRPLCLVRDVAIFETVIDGERFLTARHVDAEELWRMSLDELGVRHLRALAARDGMLVGLSEAGEVFALTP